MQRRVFFAERVGAESRYLCEFLGDRKDLQEQRVCRVAPSHPIDEWSRSEQWKTFHCIDGGVRVRIDIEIIAKVVDGPKRLTHVALPAAVSIR